MNTSLSFKYIIYLAMAFSFFLVACGYDNEVPDGSSGSDPIQEKLAP